MCPALATQVLEVIGLAQREARIACASRAMAHRWNGWRRPTPAMSS
jgi:hypothetical protein